ncbi:MAG TPA: DegV family EDD domain-containing protein [Chloroflexi bacterium]|jgi:DegV family protein with EDD domain|nr:DegV family EDD domain-containing protein [Chloroflexota bacterium]
MSITRIVTDSTAELCPEIVEALNITVVPMRIRLGTEVMVDGPELRTPEFYHTLAEANASPTVLTPTADEFARVYRRLGRETNDIVTITVSGSLNNTVRAAMQGRTGLLGRMNIQVIDSQLASRALGILVADAARAACAGASSAEVVRLVRGAISRIYFAFYAETLDHLQRNRLYDQSWATLGSSSGVEPLLMIEEGEITAVQRMRNRGTPVERLFEFVAEFPKVTVVDVLHTGLIPGASEIKSQVEQLYPGQTVGEHIIGPTFSAYAGPRCLGVVVCDN